MGVNHNTQLRNKIKRQDEEIKELKRRIEERKSLESFLRESLNKIDRRFWNKNSFEHQLIDSLVDYALHNRTHKLVKFINQYIRETIPETKRREFLDWKESELRTYREELSELKGEIRLQKVKYLHELKQDPLMFIKAILDKAPLTDI